MNGIERRVRAIEQAVRLSTECESPALVVCFVEPDGKVSSTLTFDTEANKWKEGAPTDEQP